MTGMVCEHAWTVVAPEAVTELVRGNEEALVSWLAPMVRRESVSLDLGAVERIDAAGLAALIRLYCDACQAGNRFAVMRPGRHVREVLGLVGLDRILLADEVDMFPCAEQTAA